MNAPFYIEPRGDARLKWLAVDLDRTIAQSVWPHPGIGDPIEKNVIKLKRAHGFGWKITIHTSRNWSDYEMIESWLIFHGIPFNRIVCGKVLAAYYIDDRNIDPDAESWVPK